MTATPAPSRAAKSSCLSVISGRSDFLSRSCEIDVEITSNKPAAVDKAAANPPAATRAMTQFGSLANSGLARTMMSRLIVISLRSSPA